MHSLCILKFLSNISTFLRQAKAACHEKAEKVYAVCFIFYDDLNPKGEQSSIHEHFLNNSSCAEKYLDSRFEILPKAKNSYHLSVLESLFIETRKWKICKQRDFYNLKLYK